MNYFSTKTTERCKEETFRFVKKESLEGNVLAMNHILEQRTPIEPQKTKSNNKIKDHATRMIHNSHNDTRDDNGRHNEPNVLLHAGKSISSRPRCGESKKTVSTKQSEAGEDDFTS